MVFYFSAFGRRTKQRTFPFFSIRFVSKKKSVAIVGAGPAALSLAARLREDLFDITLYEGQAAPARKLLVAGDGGLNLTHSEALEAFITRYSPPSFLEKCLRFFPPAALCDWLQEIGIETYVGSSKRVFPEPQVKPIQVLQAIVQQLQDKGVQIKTRHLWKGWKEDGSLWFHYKETELAVKADLVVFALGGASWGKTGSNGTWAPLFENKGIHVLPFEASNCAYEVRWESGFLSLAEGKWLKNIAVSCGHFTKEGELVITRSGLEGGALYALSPQIRTQWKQKGHADLFFDLKPMFSLEEVVAKCSLPNRKSQQHLLREKLRFSEVHITLLKTLLSKEEFTDPARLAQKIKRLPIRLLGPGPIGEAISTVGGIPLGEVSENFEFIKLPEHYAIGEMLDWDAPTGGYLLQGCFSMGAYLASVLNGKDPLGIHIHAT